nr:TIGR00303 family protein [Dethiosulfovibrio peptidovorans]
MERYHRERSSAMFILVVGSTDISKIPGISAAGANLDVLPYTAPADADMLWWGRPRVVDWVPLDPQGHPTPAIITRAARIESDFPVTLVKAGTSVAPKAPYVETGAIPGLNPAETTSLPDGEELFQMGQELAHSLSSDDDPLVIGESVPGGTTTASLVLEALGYRGMVSSASPENPTNLKRRLRDEAFLRLGIKQGGLAKRGLIALKELGDPMQPIVAGLVSGAPKDKEIVLAGGTQMLAVAAAIRHMGISRPITVATTCYVARDVSADFNGLAEEIGVNTWSAPLDFSGSPWTGLSDYEKGYVKEGAGAGGAVWYAERLGVPTSQVISRTEKIYGAMVETNV